MNILDNLIIWIYMNNLSLDMIIEVNVRNGE